jgi:hypothetical protein
MVKSSNASNWIASAALALVMITFGGGEAVAQAGIEEFDFQLVQETVRQGDDAIVEVKLIHTPTGKLVPGAVIFARRMDMDPDGMPTMTADLTLESSPEAGVYRFRTSLSMDIASGKASSRSRAGRRQPLLNSWVPEPNRPSVKGR